MVNTLDWIKESACIVYDNVDENPKLALFLKSNIYMNKKMVFKKLQSVLPAYMLPDKIEIAEDLPYTNIGKIDYKKLASFFNDTTGGKNGKKDKGNN